jgi:hypothetical protein
VGGVATVLIFQLLAGCGTEAVPPTSTTTATIPGPATSEAPDTTTVTVTEVGPQPLPTGALLEPGEYITTGFRPAVVFRIASKRPLRTFVRDEAIALQNRWPFPDANLDLGPYRGVGIHNRWLAVPPGELEAELAELAVAIGSTLPTEVAGLAGTQIDVTVENRSVLWSTTREVGEAWVLEQGERYRFIILETPAGSILITIGADAEEWDEFLPVAEEILAGISFPDLG